MIGPLRSWRFLGLCVLSVLSLHVAAATSVRARREATFGYPYSRVWTSAVRLMRVDFEATITEKDRDDGYFLFEYKERGKSYPGSVQLMPVQQAAGGESVRVVLTIQALPTYVENMMVDRLARKLEQEFGPPRASGQGPSRPSVDAGAPKDDTDDSTDTPSEPRKPKRGAASGAKTGQQDSEQSE